jgi:dephospho-CoA kinase
VIKLSALWVGFLSTQRANHQGAVAFVTMRLVGLTGGIGSGKSTVADLLRAKGAVVVDADEVARAVVEPGQPALDALIERFGPGILDASGRLDRPALAAIAFADDDGRKALGDITWPAIGEEFERRIKAAPHDAVVVCDVPLLVESKAAAARPYVAVIVVEAPIDVRLDRLEVRGVARDDAERRMAAQATDEERRAVATHLVDNGGDLESLARQIDRIWADLLARESVAEATSPE